MALTIAFLCSSGSSANTQASYQPKPTSFKEFREYVSSNPGKILVVDLWATWCKPCRDRFPIIHRLQDRYKSQGIEFITLSFDDPRDPVAIALATQFLQEQQANYPHFIMKDPMALVFHFLELEALPAVVIYGQNRQRTLKVEATVPTDQLSERVSITLDKWLFAEKTPKQ